MRLSARGRDTFFLAAAIAWGAGVLVLYYEQLWTLLAAGPQAWNFSDFHHEVRSAGLPYLGEAAVRAVSGVAAAVVVASAGLFAGTALDRWLTPPELAWHERLVVRFANGAGVVSIVLLGLALAGAYRAWIVGALIAMLAIASAHRAASAWRLHPRNAFAQTGHAVVASDLPWVAISVAAATLTFVTALAPETSYDALWYHLELPRRWLEEGRLTDNVHQYISLYPGTWELLFGAALALDGTVAARLVHWCTLGAGAVIAASLARRALSTGTGWAAAAIFVTAPTVLWESTTAYVDLALAMHGGLAVGALWQGTRAADRRWIVLAGFQFGLACATKHLGLVIAAVAIPLVVLARLQRDGVRRLTRTLAVVSILTILVPSPWYIRAWLASGNPVFPEMYAVFGASPPERWDDRTEAAVAAFKDRFGRPRTVASIASLPWDMTMHAWRYGGTLGPFLLLLAPALVALVSRNRAACWLAAGGTAYLLVWASPLSSYQMRFMVPWWIFVAALLAGSVALLADRAERVWPPARTGVPLVLATVALLNLPPFTPLHERHREGWDRWLTHVVHRVPLEVVTGVTSADAYLRHEVRSYGAWQYLNQHAPADARVLTFFGGDHFYAERPRLWSESVAARPVTWGATDVGDGELVERLRELRITHLLVPNRPPHRTEAHDRLVLLRPDVLAEFPMLFEDYWAAVYRVNPVPPREGSSAGAVEGAPLWSDQRYGR